MILVTGGYGCIGSELIKWLLRNSDEKIVLGSRSISTERTQRVFHDVDYQARLECVALDVSDRHNVDAVFNEHEISRVAHLGALQTPDCNAHRDLGLQINLAGTQHLLEACKAQTATIDRFVFASSIAVYGPRATYPESIVPLDASPNPVNVYGVWKLASEHLCKLYAEETGTPTISLRPGVLYGPGRDAGLTSTPTKAMKCVALGMPYEIPYQTKQDYLFAPDVGAAFANALIEPFDGHRVFTLPSHTVVMSDLVAAMQQAATQVDLAEQFQVTHGQEEVPFICDLDYGAFTKAFPNSPHTSLEQGLRESFQVYREEAAKGWLAKADVA